jgi:hypothetical protein
MDANSNPLSYRLIWVLRKKERDPYCQVCILETYRNRYIYENIPLRGVDGILGIDFEEHYKRILAKTKVIQEEGCAVDYPEIIETFKRLG